MRISKRAYMGLAALLMCSWLYGDMTVEVQGASVSFKIGDTYYANEAPGYTIGGECNKQIVIEKGSGCLQIYQDGQPLKKICGEQNHFTPLPHICDSRWRRFITSLSETIQRYIYTNENGQLGVQRGGTGGVISKDVNYFPNDKNVLLYSESWGALPNVMEVMRGEKVLKRFTFSDLSSDYAYFVVPTAELKTATAYQIRNANGVVVQKGRVLLNRMKNNNK